MRTSLVIVSLAGFLVAATTLPALGSSMGMGGGERGMTSDQTGTHAWTVPADIAMSAREHGTSRKARALLALREEGLKMRTADGGTLTQTHRSYLQAKLDAIQAGNF